MTRTRIIAAICILAAGSACTDLERTNPLDPKNRDSYNTRVSLVELFVNDSIPDGTGGISPRSGWAESAVQVLAAEYGTDNMVYAQFHVGSAYSDGLDSSLFNDYYHTCLAGADSSIPRVFVNGPGTEIGGASSEAELKGAVRSALQPYLETTCRFTIQGELEVDMDELTASARLARLGEEDAADLTVSYLFLRYAGDNHHYTVINYADGIAVPSIKAGEVIELTSRSVPNADTLSSAECSLILAVKDENGTVLQAGLVIPY